jgi:hypothetical protein
MHDPILGHVRMRAEIYRDALDPFPATINIANGERDLFNRNMARYYVEDTATSALGRAIILLKGSKKTATRESMEEVTKTQNVVAAAKAKMAKTSKEYIPVPVEDDPWTIKDTKAPETVEAAVNLVKSIIGGQTEKDIPHCKHGQRIWATGKSKAGKDWGMMKCVIQGSGNYPEQQCDPIWYEISPAGNWQPQKAKF